MALQEELDLGGYDADEVERSGGDPEPGWYWCEVDDVADDPEAPGNLRVRYLITAGPWKGHHLFDRLNHPDYAEDEVKAGNTQKRRILYATRFGLIDRGAFGGGATVNWNDLVGKLCCLKWTKRLLPARNGQPAREMSGVDFGAIFPPDDARIPAQMRATRPSQSPPDDQPTAKATPKGPPPKAPPTRRKASAVNLDDI
jgi:hypothetical protein